jgi:negative regulator of replication initiation
LLEVLVDTVEDYHREVENDRELYQVIALDAKGIAESRMTARHAADLLAKAAKMAAESRERTGATKVMKDGQMRFKTIARRTATAH